MDERTVRVHAHRDWLGAHNHRMTQIERHRSQTFEGLSVSQLRTAQVQSIGAVLDEGRFAGATKASCQSRPSGSCDDRTPTSTQESRSSATGTMPPSQTPASSRSMIVAAARTKPVKKPMAKKRAGAKATKKLERLVSKGFGLEPAEATMFRALSARANYLSQDRPDISFAAKELCREFAIPNKNSFLKLKRLVRYLCGLPRLVYE